MIWTSVYPILFTTLSEKKFRFRVGTSLSDFYDQEKGVPEGSILSDTMFIVMTNINTSCIRNGADKSLFVDEFGVSYQSKHMQAIERHLQLHLNIVRYLADNNCFKFFLYQRLSVSIFVREGVFIQIHI